MQLFDSYALEQLAAVLTFGASKYAEENWRKGISVKRLIGSSFRHLVALARGEDNDPETGLSHAAHLMCNAMFLVWMLKFNRQWDDRIIDDDQKLKNAHPMLKATPRLGDIRNADNRTK